MLFKPSLDTSLLLIEIDLINSLGNPTAVDLLIKFFKISSLIDRFDSQLFRSIVPPYDHCLDYLLHEKRYYSMLLRPRGHHYTINHISTTHFKNTFVNRCIFN